MQNGFLVLDEVDNVGTALSALKANSTISVKHRGAIKTLTLIDPIPMGHKFALYDIELKESVKKYGAEIGQSTLFIKAGQHVHLHNIESQRGRGDK